MIIQPVVALAEICAQKGIQNVVLSPGSRCAPLTIAFARHPNLTVRTVSDERAAAFIALGMAQATGKPTVLVCTSGTAALNYAPAVAEAFYQHIPLLILTADRPPEWIDQLDGQTIRQQNVYGRHIKENYTFPVDVDAPEAAWFCERLASEALNAAVAFPPGPVHINIPLREPFYPQPDEEMVLDAPVKVINEEASCFELSQQQVVKLKAEIKPYKRVLVVAGQDKYNPPLLQFLQQFAATTQAVIVGDIISNAHPLPTLVRHQDVFLAAAPAEERATLQPDLLITFGKSVISKSLKLYLRKYKPLAHWHVQPAGPVADTFQSLTNIVRCTPESFFSGMAGSFTVDAPFATTWNRIESKAAGFLDSYTLNADYSELAIVARLLGQLPPQSNLHLANSMAVRYANIIALQATQQVQVFANRGTSGIDGSTSTAVGCALTSPGITTLLTGDLAFFYDRNGLWHNYLPQNLRIVLLNNHAGGIFRLVDGPRQQPELEPYFETRQALDAENTARDFKLKYTAIHTLEELELALPAFFAPEAGAGILEVFTDSKANADAFTRFKLAQQRINFK